MKAFFYSLLILSCSSLLLAQDKETPTPGRVAFVGGTVWPVSGPPIVDGTVLIEGTRIVAVGRDVDLLKGTRIIDCTGQHVSPGFVAAASQGALGARGMNPKELASDRFDPWSDTMLFALAVGITTAHEHGGSRGGFGGFPRSTPTAFSGQPKGLQGGIIGKLTRGAIDGFSLREPAGVYFSVAYDSPAKRQETVEALESAVAYRKSWREFVAKRLAGEEVKEPRGDDVTKALAAAMDHEQPVFVHANTRSEIEIVFDLVDRFDIPMVITGGREAWTVAAEIGRRPISVLLSPRGVGGIMAPTRPYQDRFQRSEHGWRVENAAILTRAGVPWSVLPLAQTISTGGLAGRDLAALALDAAFTVRGGVSEAEALRALTLSAAEILMIDDRVGSLEVGKDADLLILDREPLDYRALVEEAWVHGRKAYDRHEAGLYAHIPHDRSAAPGPWQPFGIWSGPDGPGSLPDPSIPWPPEPAPEEATPPATEAAPKGEQGGD